MPAAIVSNLVDLPVKNRTMNWTIVTCQPYGDPMKDSTPTYAKYVYRNLLFVYFFTNSNFSQPYTNLCFICLKIFSTFSCDIFYFIIVSPHFAIKQKIHQIIVALFFVVDNRYEGCPESTWNCGFSQLVFTVSLKISTFF